MADEQVATALSSMSVNEMPPRLPNFPLPRELRDQIYGYLLDGEYVRTKRTWNRREYEDNFDDDRCGPRAYQFHTNILGVNRAINQEAEELLYKRNIFVVLSYKYFGLGNENGGLYWLPIVSNKHAPRMKSHSWAFFEALSTAKDIADAAVPYDDISFVMNLYHTVAVTLAVCTYTHFVDWAQRQAFLFTCPETAEACDVLKLEALVDKACCAIKARDSKELHEASDGILESTNRRAAEHRSQDPLSRQLKAYCFSVTLWKSIYTDAPSKMPTIKEVVERFTSPGHGLHQVHDSEILLRHPDQDAVVTRKHLPLDQCSAFQLPLPMLSHHKTLLEQERFQGWLDMDLIRSLNDDLKKKVNEEQKRFGIKATAF